MISSKVELRKAESSVDSTTFPLMRNIKSNRALLSDKNSQVAKKGWNDFRYVVLLAFICIIVYLPVFTHQFQFFWDDQWVVMNDFTEGGVNFENLTAITSQFYHGQYAPANELFYLILYTLFGYSAFWFHTASLLIHIVNVFLVFLLIKKVLHGSAQLDYRSQKRIAINLSNFINQSV